MQRRRWKWKKKGVKKMKNEKVTLGQLLNLIDNQRQSEELIVLMNDDGQEECKAMQSSRVWDALEAEEVNSIEARGDKLIVWLER